MKSNSSVLKLAGSVGLLFTIQ